MHEPNSQQSPGALALFALTLAGLGFWLYIFGGLGFGCVLPVVFVLG